MACERPRRRGAALLLKIHVPGPTGCIGRLLINGFPASILIWNEEEWMALRERPVDAIACESGKVRFALRID